MQEPTSAFHAPTASPAADDVRNIEVDRAEAKLLPTAFIATGIFYTVIAAVYWFASAVPVTRVIVYVSVFVAALFYGLGFYFLRRRVPLALMDPLITLVLVVTSAFWFLQQIIRDPFVQRDTLLLVMIAGGMFLVSRRWYAALLLFQIGGFLIITLISGENVTWSFVGVALGSGTFFSLAVFYVRHLTRRHLEALRVETEQRAAALERNMQAQLEIENELRHERDFAQQVLNLMGQALLVLDKTGHIEYANPAGARLLGFSAQELIGKTPNDLTPPQHHALLQQTRTLREQGESNTYEIELLRADGQLVPIIATGTPRGTGDSYQGAIVVGTDLTKQKHLEQQLEKARDDALDAARSKSEFLATMSHEIRTPLNSVIGMTELLLESDLAAEQRELAWTAHQSADALLTIIDDILDFTKIEANKIELERAPFDLCEIVRGAMEIVQAGAASKALEMRYTIDPTVPCFVQGDAGRLRQILLNLLSNAVKFTAQGSVRLQVETEQSSVTDSFATVRFVVRDTGIGISEAAQRRLFQPFVQADGGITRRYGGSGLGLAISKRLVELMGGEIHVDSTEGTGSTFWFWVRLPLSAAPSEKARQLREPAYVNVAATTRIVLLAEDNLTNQKLAQLQLIKLGYAVQIVGNGLAAVQAMRETTERGEAYEMILMDCQMPEMDGYAATRAIRAYEASQRHHTPIVAMTANALQGDREKCLEAGMDDYITKPVTLQVLRSILDHWTGASQTNELPVVAPPTLSDVTFDPDYLDSLRSEQAPDNTLAIQEIVRGFIAETRTRLQNMQTALAAQDYETVRRSVHSLRGSAGSLGALRLTKLATAMLKNVKQEQPTNLAEQLDAIESEFEQLCRAFAQHDLIPSDALPVTV